MARTIIGTRFTTGCGHSWKVRFPQWTVEDLRNAVTDCRHCDGYLLIPSEQFAGQDLESFPTDVHMPLFHKEMAKADPGWPEDGAGTGVIEFATDGD